MTPQDIRERNLEKALFNGYDMGAVDRLREECAEALAGREKEVATLKSKMKVSRRSRPSAPGSDRGRRPGR